MKTHDNQKPFQCTVCNRGYNTAAALTSHMQNHKKDQQQQQNGHNNSNSSRTSSNNTPSPGSACPSFRCLQCGETFRKPEELQGHMMTQHNVETRGSPPGSISRGLLGGLMLGDSPLTRSPSRPLPFPTPKQACIYCTKDSFTTMEALQLHVQAMHGSILNGDLRDFPNLSHHQASPSPMTSTALMPYSCDLCTMRFGTVHGLQKHALGVHGLMSPNNLAPGLGMASKDHHGDAASSSSGLFCAQCSLSFPSAAHFAEHYVLLHGSSSASGGLMIPSSPAPEQLKPTDLSKKPHRHSQHHEDRPQPKRHKSSADNSAPPPVSMPDTPNSTSSMPLRRECKTQMRTPEEEEQHVATHFMATATEYGCQSCLKLFPKPDELQKHLMDIHAHHLYRCSLCKEMFDSKVAIQVHFAVKHSNECKLYRCTACPSSSAVFRTELDFSLHVRSAHAPIPLMTGSSSKTSTQQPYRCLFCRLSFASEIEMQFHLAAHSKQFHCPLCQEAFHVEFLLDKHMQTHHSSQVMNNNGTTSAENLSQQQKSPKIKSNSNGRNSSGNIENNNSKKGEQVNSNCCCDICDRCDFASEAELVAHRKLVHHIKPSTGKNGAVSLHCAYCSENCKSRTELENHMKTHSQGSSGSGKHKCNICDELCPSAAVLAEHKLTHCKVISGSTCTQCKATLVNEEQFYTHLQQHNNNNNNSSSSAQGNTNSAHQQVVLPTPCVVCRQTLISDIEVRMHARFHLKNSAALTATEPMYQCCLCLKQFEMQNLIVTGDCYHCHSKTSPSQQSSQQQQQQLSLQMQQQEQVYRCSECQVKFETSAALEAHLVSVHRKTYQCIKCQVSFETEREIQMHVATHLLTEGSSHECHLCRRLLATPLKLQAHLIEHTFAGCGSFTCYLCSAVFTAAQGLQQHMLEHGLAARPYDCSHCSLRFFFRAELDNHSFSHLEENAANMANQSGLLDGADMASKREEEEFILIDITLVAKKNRQSAAVFPCQTSKAYDAIHAAYYHHLSSNGSYEASNPDLHYYKTLVQESSKQQKHKSNKSHSNKGPALLKCLECNKEFSSILGLQAHQRHHKHSQSSSKKVYTCNECGKEFGMARNLSVHMRSHHEDHGGEERSKSGHTCPACHRDFPDLDSLDGHITSQHFRCPQCGEVFSRQRHLAEHIRKKRTKMKILMCHHLHQWLISIMLVHLSSILMSKYKHVQKEMKFHHLQMMAGLIVCYLFRHTLINTTAETMLNDS
ncbi:hypothetical protein L9F63_016570, partial [Diploptera punctata]